MSISDQVTEAAPGAYTLATSDPHRLALLGPDGTTMTYAQLGEAANRLANALRGLGLRTGDVVATLLHNSAEHFVAVLATGQIGLYLVPVNVHLAPAEAAYIVADSGAKVLLAHADLAAGLAPVSDQLPAARYSVDGSTPGWYDRAALDGAPTPPADRTAGAIMGYTSGTTGRPKGVRRALLPLTPEVLAEASSGFLSRFGLRPGRGVHLVCSPLYHAAPGNVALQALHLGHTVVIQARFDAEGVLRDVQRHRVTSTQVVPTHLHRMLRLPAETRAAYDLSSLTTVLVAGAPFAAESKNAVLDWLGPVVWEYLASTEGIVAVASPDDALTHPGSVGRPTGGVRILDAEGVPVARGEVGTIHFALPMLFEYHNDPVKTAAAVSADGYATAGDLGRLDDDSYLYLLDRRDELIISGGVNIYPAEVEQRLIQHPAVADVAVVGAADPEWGQSVVAVVELEPGREADDDLVEALGAHCRAALAALKCPRRYEFRPALPRTATGKILRRELRREVS